MLDKNFNLNDEWLTFRSSLPKILLTERELFIQGAFCIYKIILAAEDEQDKLREAMVRLGEEFRKEFK